MDTEEALQKIRKNLLTPKESVLWWDRKKRKEVEGLVEALEAIKDNKKITERRFLKEKFDSVYILLRTLLSFYEGRLTKEQVLDTAKAKEISDDMINDHLAKIVSELETRMVELTLDINDFPDREAFCIPGCSVCCLTTGSGVIVYDDELKKVEEGLRIFNGEYNCGNAFDHEDIHTKEKRIGMKSWRKTPAAALPAFDRLPDHIMLLKQEGFEYREKPDHMCSFLIDRKTEQVNFHKWRQLVMAYSEKLKLQGISLDLGDDDFPGYFQGLICGIYPHRPYQCAKKGCNYARKMMPRIIKKFGAAPLQEMFREKTLLARYRIANKYFKITI